MDNESIIFRLNLIIALLISILVILLIPILSVERLVLGVFLVGFVFPLLYLIIMMLR